MPSRGIFSLKSSSKHDRLPSVSSKSSSPPPSYSSAIAAPVTTLQIVATDKLGLNLTILPQLDEEPFYTVENNVRSYPSQTMFIHEDSPKFPDAGADQPTKPTPRQIATNTILPLSSSIPMTFKGEKLTLEPRGMFKSGVRFSSAALNGETLVWKPEKKVSSASNWLLISEADEGSEGKKGSEKDGRLVARYLMGLVGWRETGKPRSMDTSGSIEIFEGASAGTEEVGLGEKEKELDGDAQMGIVSQRLVDEIVVTGVAVVEQRRRKNSRAVGGGVGVSAVGAAGGGAV